MGWVAIYLTINSYKCALQVILTLRKVKYHKFVNWPIGGIFIFSIFAWGLFRGDLFIWGNLKMLLAAGHIPVEIISLMLHIQAIGYFLKGRLESMYCVLKIFSAQANCHARNTQSSVQNLKSILEKYTRLYGEEM